MKYNFDWSAFFGASVGSKNKLPEFPSWVPDKLPKQHRTRKNHNRRKNTRKHNKKLDRENSTIPFLKSNEISTIYSDGNSKLIPDRVVSGDYTLIINPDGNIVLYKSTKSDFKIIWQSDTHRKEHFGYSGFKLVMQPDGNLVAYDKDYPYWASNTVDNFFKEHNNYKLSIENGKIELYSMNKLFGNEENKFKYFEKP
jgi:hypothetical protein